MAENVTNNELQKKGNAGKDISAKVSGAERELATLALTHFNKGEYSCALDHTRKLENTRPKDPKVCHLL